MTSLNYVIMCALGGFALLGALDRVLKQFEVSPRFLAAIEGAGKQFEEGFNTMGPLALAMVGIIAATPLIGAVVAPIVIPLYRLAGANPAMFAGSLLAVDMGGYGLARNLATVNGQLDWASFLYSGIILGSMMGATLVFTIPVGLGLISPSNRRPFALGILAGLVTVPLGCLAAGVTAIFLPPHSADGKLVVFQLGMLLRNIVPVVLLSALLAMGLWKFEQVMVRAFIIFAKVLVAFMTASLGVVAFQILTGVTVISGLDAIFPVAGDMPGMDLRAMELVGRIGIALLGAYTGAFLISRWLAKPLMAVGRCLGINEVSAAGLIATLASNLPMLKLMDSMDERGKIVNVAFCVSAAFVFADHLAFVAANQPDMITPVIVGKLVGGVSAVLFALAMTRRSSQGSL